MKLGIASGALLAAIACVGTLGSGCEKKKEGGLPPATEWSADGEGSGTAPGAANPHTGADPHAGLDVDPHAGVDVTGMQEMAPDPARPIDATKFLRGSIVPGKEQAGKIPAGATIFLSVKRPDPSTGQPTGAPIAVERFDANFPIQFEVTEASQMIKGTSFEGDVVISVWWDQDGDAATKQPGDLLGSVKATIPAKDLVVTLDQVRP
jgi:hypothetical protein